MPSQRKKPTGDNREGTMFSGKARCPIFTDKVPQFGDVIFFLRVRVPSHSFEKTRFSGGARKIQRTHIQKPEIRASHQIGLRWRLNMSRWNTASIREKQRGKAIGDMSPFALKACRREALSGSTASLDLGHLHVSLPISCFLWVKSSLPLSGS